MDEFEIIITDNEFVKNGDIVCNNFITSLLPFINVGINDNYNDNYYCNIYLKTDEQIEEYNNFVFPPRNEEEWQKSHDELNESFLRCFKISDKWEKEFKFHKELDAFRDELKMLSTKINNKIKKRDWTNSDITNFDISKSIGDIVDLSYSVNVCRHNFFERKNGNKYYRLRDSYKNNIVKTDLYFIELIKIELIEFLKNENNQLMLRFLNKDKSNNFKLKFDGCYRLLSFNIKPKEYIVSLKGNELIVFNNGIK